MAKKTYSPTETMVRASITKRDLVIAQRFKDKNKSMVEGKFINAHRIKIVCALSEATVGEAFNEYNNVLNVKLNAIKDELAYNNCHVSLYCSRDLPEVPIGFYWYE